MSDQGSSVPPCWAADPSGRHRFRYWDGTAWTGHVADGDVPPTAAPGPPPTEARVAEPEHPPVRQPPVRQPPVGQAAESRYVVEVPEGDDTAASEREEPRAQRRPPRSGRSFWTGALVGGLVVAALAAGAWVAFGGSSTETKVVTRAPTTTRATTTTTLTPSTSLATSTTVTPVTSHPPAQVRVEVVNASGVEGAAGTKADALKAAGYPIAGLGNATIQQGTTVACKTGYDAEAAALAQVVGGGAKVVPMPSPPPPGSESADCVVTVGK